MRSIFALGPKDLLMKGSFLMAPSCSRLRSFSCKARQLAYGCIDLARGAGRVRMGLCTCFRLFSCRQSIWACFLALLRIDLRACSWHSVSLEELWSVLRSATRNTAVSRRQQDVQGGQ